MLLSPDPPADSLAPSPRPPSAGRTSPAGQDEGTEGRTEIRPRPAAPHLAPARPGQGCPQHVSRRAPALRRPLPPPLGLLAAGADPRPLPAAGSSAGLAGSCKVLSPPPNLAPSLPQEPPFESAHAAPNLIGRGGRTRGRGRGGKSARRWGRGRGAGSRDWNSRASGGSREPGVGRRAGFAGPAVTDPEARGAAPRGGGAPRAARGLLGGGVAAFAERRVWKRRPGPGLPGVRGRGSRGMGRARRGTALQPALGRGASLRGRVPPQELGGAVFGPETNLTIKFGRPLLFKQK